jgi:hypothetical protein
MSEVNTTDYENRVLTGLRRALINSGQQRGAQYEGSSEQRVVVEEVRLETSSTGPNMISILYRDRRRPECLFGWQREAVEPTSSTDVSPLGPELWTTITYANFTEHVEGSPDGLPADCLQDEITWTN